MAVNGPCLGVGDKADMIDRIDMTRESPKEVEAISDFRSWVRGEHMNVEKSRNNGRDDWKERSWDEDQYMRVH